MKHSPFSRILPILIASTLAFTSFANAAPSGGERGAVIEKLRQLQSDLALSDGQKKRVREVLTHHRDELRTQRSRTAAAREKVRAATETYGSSSGETQRAADDLARLAKTRILLTAKILEEIKPILTPDQVNKLKAVRGSFHVSGD